MKSKLNDFTLTFAAKTGDDKSFTILLDRYKQQIYLLLLKMLGNETTAEDLTIEVFTKAFANIKQYSPDYAFSTWLYKIATNHCIDYIRRKQYQPNIISRDNDELHTISDKLLSDSLTPEEIIIDDQHTSIIQKKLYQLTDNHRTIIDLRYFKEYSYEEIAKTLNIPIGTVKGRLHRARKALHKILL
jgi:RNA polymerase sigma factor (sigma-70 family)